MRRRFAVDGDRTVGEVKAQEAIRDGFRPYDAPARRSNPSERHVTRANSLPTPQKEAVRPVQRVSLSGSSIAIIVLCGLLLIALLFSGLHISRLDSEKNALQNGPTLMAENSQLTLVPEDTNSLGARESDPVLTDNLLAAFSN